MGLVDNNSKYNSLLPNEDDPDQEKKSKVPWDAIVTTGGSFLANLMDQQFKASQEKKKMNVDLALKGGSDQERSSDQMINVYKDILTRR